MSLSPVSPDVTDEDITLITLSYYSPNLSQLNHVFKNHVRHVEVSKANRAILRRYKYFLAPADHENYQGHGWYQCQCRKDTSRIEQDKERH